MTRDRSTKPQNTLQIPLRVLLLVPFVLQIVGAVGLVGYLSYRSGQQAVGKLADKLMTQTSNNIEQHLDSYLGKAQEINRTNVDAFHAGIFDLNDFNALGKYFYRQVTAFNFAAVTFGGKEGGSIGGGYIGFTNKKHDFEIVEILQNHSGKGYAYYANDQGDRVELYETLENSQINNRAWYLDAVKAGKPIWSAIYNWAYLPQVLAISASTPVYNHQKQLLGVFAVKQGLWQISQFLKKLNGNSAGHIFIMERSGLLVASSGNELSTINNGKATRLKALNSREPLIHDVTEKLIQQFGSLKAINQPQLLRLNLTQNFFVRIIPYQDQYGLDWLTVVVIPE